MPKHRLVWLFAAFAMLIAAGTASAAGRVTDASIRFVTGSDTSRIEISLGTNPAILERRRRRWLSRPRWPTSGA